MKFRHNSLKVLQWEPASRFAFRAAGLLTLPGFPLSGIILEARHRTIAPHMPVRKPNQTNRRDALAAGTGNPLFEPTFIQSIL